MNYEMLTEEIKTLPETLFSEVSDFVKYLKFKENFHQYDTSADDFQVALENWRNEAQDLFGDSTTAPLMENAFKAYRNEQYTTKDIW